MRYIKFLSRSLLIASTMSHVGCASSGHSDGADADLLAQQWATLRAEQPRLLARDAAQKLQVSEAELLTTSIGTDAVRLRDGAATYEALYARLHELGQIRVITRNDAVVLERVGTVVPVRRTEQGRHVLGTGLIGGVIDLRPAMGHWGYGFALVQAGKEGKLMRSLQFFDHNGHAVNKVYLDNEVAGAAFDKLVADFKIQDQLASLKIGHPPVEDGSKPATGVDLNKLRRTWNAMTDVHEFSSLLKTLNITREQVLELIGTDAAYRIHAQSLPTLLYQLAQQKQPVMVFVGNTGMMQIFSGTITRVERSGEWLNVLDPDFHLHLRMAAIDRGWVLKRPTSNGIITSVEFYDAKGEQVINFFSRRERQQQESDNWRKLVAGLTVS